MSEASAHTEFVDLAEQVIRGVTRENRRQTRLDADPHQRQSLSPATRRRTRTDRRRVFTPVNSYGFSGCLLDRLIAVSR